MRMVKGGRALAAALAGAQLWIASGSQWLRASRNAVHRFERHYNSGHPAANLYGVVASEAAEVLGPDQKGRLVS